MIKDSKELIKRKIESLNKLAKISDKENAHIKAEAYLFNINYRLFG